MLIYVLWKGGRVAEGGGLLIRCWVNFIRGFESLPFRFLWVPFPMIDSIPFTL